MVKGAGEGVGVEDMQRTHNLSAGAVGQRRSAINEWLTLTRGHPLAQGVLVSRLMNVPVAIISIIDYDGDRQFFKSQCGLALPWSETRQTPLSHSFCRIVAESNAPMRVSDARTDDRVKNNPAITALGVIVACHARPRRP